MAIRRPDGYVQKPQLATDVFAMDTGDSTLPAFDSGFPVDFAMLATPASSGNNRFVASRLTSGKYLATNGTDGENSHGGFAFDYNDGWKGSSDTSSWLSWMWKRYAGFDVVTYTGNGNNTDGANAISHSLGKTPEMIWIKTRSGGTYSGATHWTMSHKDFNGGTNPWQYTMCINLTNAEAATSNFGNTAPTSTHFYVGDPGNGRSNDNNSEYIALLFSSVAGISKVGSYSGSNSNVTLDLGFSPRYMFIKQTNGTHVWMVFDTLRGMGTGNVPHLHFNNDAGSVSDRDW
jgi:hypothetical protein